MIILYVVLYSVYFKKGFATSCVGPMLLLLLLIPFSSSAVTHSFYLLPVSFVLSVVPPLHHLLPLSLFGQRHILFHSLCLRVFGVIRYANTTPMIHTPL